jgi:hypothetical protein
MLAAIEIYNKPRIEYREEVFVQLLVNSWELVLKSVLAKRKVSIFYPKRRNEPRRSLSLTDALEKMRVHGLWPQEIDAQAIELNIEYLKTFRDQTVHFYGEAQLAGLVSALSVSSIQNYQRLLTAVFGKSLSSEITWELMPLSFRTPSDVVRVLREADRIRKPEVREFVTSFAGQISRINAEGRDSGAFALKVDISLESKKRMTTSDLSVAINTETGTDEVMIIDRRLDPNKSHPLRQKEVVQRIAAKRPGFNSYDFQALIWKLKLRENEQYCWIDQINRTSRWSNEIVSKLLAVDEKECIRIRKQFSAANQKRQRRSG